ncbi:unnamed protein product [Prunus armeniaca]
MTIICAEHRLFNVRFMHSDLVVAEAKIQFGKYSDAMEFVKEFIDHGDGKTILNGASIEGAVVNT